MSNKLINEDSPYLKQHSSNPINWHSWGDEALELAKKEGKPIFVSIGYSSCHWCHVMERESFENEEIASFLNEYFISIKVDKEERPDIDRHFQEIYIKMNNKAGGWPLSIFVTPNLVPIYSGTYIPPMANYGLMGFKDLVNTIVKSYQKDPDMLIKKGKEILDALKPKSKIEATKIDDTIISIAIEQIKQVYEPKFGGFSTRPKFPHTYSLNLAINLYKLTKDDKLKEIVDKTLTNMLLGGIYDIVDGGLCRYSTDEQWLVPHFEKMTYDNALFIETLLKAYEVTDRKLYIDKALEVANFMLNKMSQNGLFFTASDADTEGVEGRYFIYNYSKTKEAFEKAGLSLELLDKLNITENGNFDSENIARLESVELYDDGNIKEAIELLKSIREDREYPSIDNKIITSWNCMMINSLCKLGKYDSAFINLAKEHLDAIESKMVDGTDIYHSSLIDSNKRVDGFLEDYSWLIKAYLSYYEISLDELYLIKATNLANEAVKKFYKNGRWVVGVLEFTNFVEVTDASFPSSVAVMTQNMLTLKSLVEPIYEKFAFSTLQVSSYKLMRQPISMPTMTNEAIRHLKDDIIVKSNEKKLKEVLSFRFKYPYTLLKVTSDDNYQLCNNKACFAQFNSKDELIGNI